MLFLCALAVLKIRSLFAFCVHNETSASSFVPSWLMMVCNDKYTAAWVLVLFALLDVVCLQLIYMYCKELH